jgi:diguanylate cyclase
MKRLALAYLGAGGTAIGIYYLLPTDSTGQALAYDLVGASAAAATVFGALRNRSDARWPWLLSAIGLASFTTGDVIFNVYSDVLHETPPLPSAADVFYVGGYPLLTLGFALMIRRVGGWRRRAAMIDAAIVSAVFTLAQWLTVMAPVLTRPQDSAAAKAVALAYPTGDVLLLAALACFFLTPAWQTVSYRWLIASERRAPARRR